MMKVKILFFLLVLLMQPSFAQTDVIISVPKDSLKNIIVNPFDHQDNLGQSIYIFFLSFESTGHFADLGQNYSSAKVVKTYTELFDASAVVPNDLQMKDTLVGKPISIDAYAKLAKKHGYFAHRLIIEKRMINATRVDSGRYRGVYHYFKLFSDKALLGEAYQHGATYEMVFEFNEDGSDISINSIAQMPNGEFHKFKLGNFGYTSNNNIMATNSLKSLIQEPTLLQKEELKPPKDSADYRAQPAFAIYGGYVIPDYLWAANYADNLNPIAGSSTEQSGYDFGARLQLPLGKKGNLNLFLGLGYEQNKYKVNYNDLQFIYTTDCFGKPLEDIEGNPYDEKWVDVSTLYESGELSFLKPEVGLLYKINLGEKIQLNLMGALGYSYLSKSHFEMDATVSYRGRIKGLGNPISSEDLGFYTDYSKTNFGEITNISSFAYYKFGGSLDFRLGKQNYLSLGFEWRTGLTPVFTTGSSFWPFLDPAVNDTFLSSFTNVPEERTYQSMAILLSYKFQLKKK